MRSTDSPIAQQGLRTRRANPAPKARVALSALAGLLAAGAAEAQLVIVDFEVRAAAHATQAGQSASLTRSDDTPLGLPWALTAGLDSTAGTTLLDQVVTGTTSATQTKTGWFSSHTIANHDWQSRRSELGSSTQFYLLLETTQPDTPLVLHFNFLGSRLRADAYYGGNGVALDAAAWIAVERNPAPGSVPDETAAVWGIADRLDFANGYRFTPQSIDTQNIGTPTLHTGSRWQEMRNIGEMNRDSFSGTLDFGLLQPGERFAFVYGAHTNIHLQSPYASVAAAEVIDPFAFDSTPAPQFTFDGLTLPPPPVPEPSATLLGLLGLGLLSRHVHRRRGA